MGVRVEFEIKKLPDSYVTNTIHHGFEDEPGGKKDKNGNVRQRIVTKEVEERGGWLLIVRGRPGHSIRFTTRDQLEAFKLVAQGQEVRPRLVNTETGEECDERGVPLSVASVMNTANASERIETDIDVTHNDEQLEIDTKDPAERAVGASITALE